MTREQRDAVSGVLEAAENDGTFIGLTVRPANESDSIYGIPVNPDGADLYISCGVLDAEEVEYTSVSVVDPAGAFLFVYEPN